MRLIYNIRDWNQRHLDTIISIMFSKYYTLLTLIQAKYWRGVNIGKNCEFRGIPYIRKAPNSIINIGNNCVFNSMNRFNLAGINHPCHISTFNEKAILKIGDNCGFSGTVIAASQNIIIGNNVLCGSNTLIADNDWHNDRYISVRGETLPVKIGDNVWIGMGSYILKGVTIEDNSIIAAGSVVTKSMPSNIIAAGVPAKIIKKMK